MAFCPNCGKPVTEQASKCLACGQEFEPRAKSARFKGTMMMTPATAPQPPTAATPAAAAAQPAAAKPQPSPAAAAAPRATAPGPSKVAKATMLGTGGLGFAPPAGLGAKPGAPVQPPPAAGAGAPLAKPQPPAPEPAPAAPQDPPARFAAGGQDPAAEDSQRFLVGDPMAPAPAAQRSARRAGREDGDANVPVQRTSLLLAIGLIGMAVIAAVGYATARFMGLVN